MRQHIAWLVLVFDKNCYSPGTISSIKDVGGAIAAPPTAKNNNSVMPCATKCLLNQAIISSALLISLITSDFFGPNFNQYQHVPIVNII